MSREININRQLLGLEDILFGTGTVEQIRGGQLVTVTKVNAGNLPFDETQNLLEWAQSVNLEQLGNIITELQAIYDNLASISNVEDNLSLLNNIISNITVLQELHTNLSILQNVNSNITIITEVNTNLDILTSIYNNLSALVNIHTNLTSLLAIDTNMQQLLAIDTNLPELLSINTHIVPNITEILDVNNKASEANTSANTANTQANIAITKASEASISAINALTSENNADTSEANALIYRNQAESFANSINPSDLVHISGTETITGDKTFTGTISGLTKETVGLSNVDNTSDTNKPISDATANALAGKQNTLVSGTNIKTINGSSILGSGDLVISGGSGSGITVTEYDITAMGTTQFSIPALDDIVIIKCKLQSSYQSVILPTTGATLNQIVEIQCKATNTNNPLLVNTSGSISLYPNQSIKVRFNGSFWELISYDCSINSGYGSSSYFNVDNGSLNLDAIGKGVVNIVTSSSASYDILQLKDRFNQVQIIAIGGGGAGGSGRKGAASTARSGGAGGGAGGVTDITLNTISLGSSLNIVIGAGGTGGLAVTTNSTNGNVGGNGGLTSVTLSGDANGTVIVASGGTGGGGGTTAIVNGAVGSFSVKDSIRGTQQGAGGTTSVTTNPNTPTAATSYVPTGGGAGGGISTSNVAYNGGAGGSIAANTIGSTTTVVAVGGSGGVVASTIPQHGKLIGNFIATAPGGGAASLVAFGPQSGLSPAYGYGCGGSGGGAAVDAVNDSGAGGAGSSGAVILRFF